MSKPAKAGTPPQHSGPTAAGQARRKRPQAAATLAAQQAGTLPALTPQPHGGALLRGGVPGNAGPSLAAKVTSGRLRQEMRDALAELGLDRLRLVLADPQATHAEAVAAFNALLAGVKKPTARVEQRQITELVVELRDESGSKYRLTPGQELPATGTVSPAASPAVPPPSDSETSP